MSWVYSPRPYVYRKSYEKRHTERYSTMEVGIRELRDNLSKWIAEAQKGQDIVITDRGKPAARLSRFGDSPALQRLIE